MHKSWGRSPILVRILSLCFHQNFVWSFTCLYFWKINHFSLVLCAIMKSVEGLVYLLEPCSLWELLISFVNLWFTFLKWDKSLSMCVLLILYAHWFCLVLLLNLDSILCWFESSICFGQPCVWSHLLCSLVLISVLSIFYLFWVLKVCACIFSQYISYGMFHFLWSNI